MSTVAERSSIKEIKSIRVGDTIVLTDEQSIVRLMEKKAKDAANGLDMEVRRIRRIDVGVGEYIVADLVSAPSDELFLVAKIVEGEMDVRLYFPVPGFEQGITKGEALERELRWLFAGPADRPADMALTATLEQNTDNGMIYYNHKCPAINGEVSSETPRPLSVRLPYFTSVTEYLATSEITNPEIIIMEVGGIDNDGDRIDAGPCLYFWQGCNIRPNDYKVINC